MIRENQNTISAWADRTFGKATEGPSRKRLLDEVTELKEALENNAPIAEVLAELADCIIAGSRLATVVQYSLPMTINLKMDINRKRRWRLNGDGTGKHIKD